MMKKQFKLNKKATVFVIIGAGVIIALVGLWNKYLYYPTLERYCSSTCRDLGYIHQTVKPGYVATSIEPSCFCISESKSQIQTYFVFENKVLDWLFITFFKLIALGLIIFISVYMIAKIVVKIQA
jgi:hypothetical protein